MTRDLHVEVSDSVILETTEKIVNAIPGVHSLSIDFFGGVVDGITTKWGQKFWPGMNVKHKKDEQKEPFIEVNIYICAKVGYPLVILGKGIQDQVRRGLHDYLHLERVRVDVHFESLVKEEGESLDEQKEE